MGKIIISESQYRKVKSILIENAINESLLNEEAYTLDTKKYSLKTNDSTSARGTDVNDQLKVIGGATYTPTQRGNLSAKGEIEYINSGIRKKTTINFICANNKINADGKFYDVFSNNPTLEGFKKLCETLKKVKKDSYGIQQTGGAVKGYSQQNTYTLKSKDGKKTITIPKGTGYTAKKDQKGREGASFKLGPTIFGWFGCKSKSFFIDKVLYVDEKGALATNLSKAVCGASTVEPQKEPKTKADNVVDGGKGQRLATQDSIVSDMANYV
jgi:hypothetical protein